MTNKTRKHSRLSWRLARTYASIFSLLRFALNVGVLYEASAQINYEL